MLCAVLSHPQIEELYTAAMHVVDVLELEPDQTIPLVAVVFARAVEHAVTARYMTHERHQRLNAIIKQGLESLERSTS